MSLVGYSQVRDDSSHRDERRRASTRRRIIATACLAILTLLFWSPLFNMVATSFKDPDQNYAEGAPIWPSRPKTIALNGESVPVVLLPQDDGTLAEMVLIKPGRQESVLAPVADPTQTFVWQGKWRSLEYAWEFSATLSNYGEVWKLLDFPRLLFNTLAIAIVGTIGTVLSCVLVAYGFSRFRFPGRDRLFQVMVATIFIPGTVTLIPTYILFLNLGWMDTWLPLLVPTFLANAFDVFLIRQYILTIPREQDEAAQIDGANTLQTLWYVIIPQARPVIIAVTVFHFVYSWNDYFGPLIYLSTKPDLQPLAVALARFGDQYNSRIGFPEAATMLTLIIPVVLFMIFQRYFVRGVVVTGTEK